jgi:GT2 family glycosyltransferase
VTGAIDVLIVLYNSRRWISDLLAGLREVSIPVRVYFLDNGSTDGTPDLLAAEIPSLPFQTYLLRSIHNNGFARGINLLSVQSQSEFMFLLNPDARLEKNCLETLLARAQADNRIGICEARQSPREHPKAWDKATGETTWCSGAAALIRRRAFEDVHGFDERLFFMYCEDVDFSWRLWLKDWKCVYVPDAVVQHFTQDLALGKRRTAENYFTFRNSLFLYYRFGTKKDRGVLRQFLRRRFLSRAYSLRSKALFAIALVEHIRYIPSLLRNPHRRDSCHPWIRLRETSLFQ